MLKNLLNFQNQAGILSGPLRRQRQSEFLLSAASKIWQSCLSLQVAFLLILVFADFKSAPSFEVPLFLQNLLLIIICGSIIFLNKNFIFSYLARIRNLRKKVSFDKNKKFAWGFYLVFAAFIVFELIMKVGVNASPVFLLLIPILGLALYSNYKSIREKINFDHKINSNRQFFLEQIGWQNFLFCVVPFFILTLAALLAIVLFCLSKSVFYLYLYCLAYAIVFLMQPDKKDFFENCKRCAALKIKESFHATECENCHNQNAHNRKFKI